MKKVLIWGYYGQKNFGDDLMLDCAKEYLRSTFRNSQVYITMPSSGKNIDLGGDFQLTPFNLYEKSLLSWLSPIIAVFRLIGFKHIVVLGGTQYFEVPHRKFYNYLNFTLKLIWFVIPWIFGTKIYHIGIGTGNLDSKYSRAITRLLFKISHITLIRDEKSVEFLSLKRLGSSHIVSSDLSFVRNMHSELQMMTTTNRIAINILDYYRYIENDELRAEVLDRKICLLHESLINLGFTPVYFALQVNKGGFDDRIIGILESKYGQVSSVFYDNNVEEIGIELVKCNCAIGMRFHFALLCLQSSIPCIGISYQPKVNYLFESFGLSDLILTVDEFVLSDLDELLGKLFRVKIGDIAEANSVFHKEALRVYGRAFCTISDV